MDICYCGTENMKVLNTDEVFTDEDPHLERTVWMECVSCGAKFRVNIRRTGKPVRSPAPSDTLSLPSPNATFDLGTPKTPYSKHNNLCLQKAAEDEPLFVLRAQDALAPMLIAMWIQNARECGASPEKIEDVQKLLRAVVAWPVKKYPD